MLRLADVVANNRDELLACRVPHAWQIHRPLDLSTFEDLIEKNLLLRITFIYVHLEGFFVLKHSLLLTLLCVLLVGPLCGFSAESEHEGTPEDHEAFMLRILRGRDNSIDTTALIKARAALEKYNADADSVHAVAPRQAESVATQEATNFSWQELGPSDVGGLVWSLAPHPTMPNRLFAGTASSGVWRSDDKGKSWTQMGQNMLGVGIRDIAISQSNPEVIYAATEGAYQVPAGIGLYRSMDGGSSWTVVPGTVPQSASDVWDHIERIWIDPTKVNIVLAATGQGVYRTTDGAQSWIQVLPQRVGALVANPTNHNALVAADASHGGAHRSLDGGITWTDMPIGPPNLAEVALAWSTSSPTTIYAFASDPDSPSTDPYPTGNIYVSTNSGTSFTLKSHGGQTSTRVYRHAIWVDPHNVNNIVVDGAIVSRSLDGGTTFFDMVPGSVGPPDTPEPNQDFHQDQHAIAAPSNYDGVSNTTIFFASDGGVSSNDSIFSLDTNAATNGWYYRSRTLAITQVYHVAANDFHVVGQEPQPVVCEGSQDNGIFALYENPTPLVDQWNILSGGDGEVCAFPKQAKYGGYVFAEAQYYSAIRVGPTLPYDHNTDSLFYDFPDTASFDTPYALDESTQPPRLVVGGADIWQRPDAFANLMNGGLGPHNWQKLIPRPFAEGTWTHVSFLDLAPSDGNVAWFAFESDHLYKSQNMQSANPTLTLITPPLAFGSLTSIHISRTDSSTVYLTYGGTSNSHIFATHDGGATWIPIDQTLPNIPVAALTEDPYDSSILYAGTVLGVFVSGDAGVSWQQVPGGPGSIVATSFAWRLNQLVVGTFGRGVFLGQISPRILLFNPTSGAAGTSVNISGIGFDPANISVAFNGVNASVTSATVSSLTVLVPTTAATGRIQVVTDKKTATSTTDFVVPVVVPVALTITSTHNSFYQGEIVTNPPLHGAIYTLAVRNSGSAPSSGQVTVTDTLPAGLVPIVASGSGWTCGYTPVVCRRSDTLAAGASYPTISVAVNVPYNAPLSVTNIANVSGGGTSGANTFRDVTAITAEPYPQIAVSHTGSFTRNQTNAQFTLVVTNNGSAVTRGTVTVTENPLYGLSVLAMGGTGWVCTTTTCSRADAVAPGSAYPPITATMYVMPDAPATVQNVVTALDNVTGLVFSSTARDAAAVNSMVPGTSPDLAVWIDTSGIPRVENVSSTSTFSNVNVTVTLSFQTAGLVFTPPAGCTLKGTGKIGSIATYNCAAGSLAPAASVPFSFQCDAGSGAPLGTISASLVTPTTPPDTNASNNAMSTSMACSTNTM
jgi:photosystem II stability/assembly factor-like uncharacterized protein